MITGVKSHSHEERAQLVDALVPLIQRHVGENLIALAVTGSFARNSDREYSDIELIGIVERPAGDKVGTTFIHDGMMVDIWCLTAEEYLREHRTEVGPFWPYAASNTLIPLLNDPLINELNDSRINDSEDARYKRIAQDWPVFQESVAKIFNADLMGNDDAIGYLFWQMAEKTCVLLSLLNGRPFSTRAAAFTEVRGFERLPKDFLRLMRPSTGFGSREEIVRTTRGLFETLERLLLDSGITLYAPSLDAFVVDEVERTGVRQTLKLYAIARKIRAFAEA